MGIITKEVEVKLNGKVVKHYEELGYIIPKKPSTKSYFQKTGKEYVYNFEVPIVVKTEDLTEGSNVLVDILCDYCKSEILTMPYYRYKNSLKVIEKYSCNNCKGKKIAEENMIKYGVPNIMQLNDVKERAKDSTMKKYGVDNYLKKQEHRDYIRDIIYHRYGVKFASQNEDIKEAVKQTCLSKYGVEYSLQAKEVRDKIRQSCIDKYGVPNPAQLPEIREKMSKTLYANSSQKVSKQQRYINNLYQGILNYPIKYYNVDIYLPDDNLTIEYDGGFHLGNVITGRETQEEFDQKEIIRNNIIKREGYKQMRIISLNDKLPQDSTLLQMLSETRQYFTLYPNHSWIEFNISTSTIRNAENPQGLLYQFGTLRTIKDSDITINNISIDTQSLSHNN